MTLLPTSKRCKLFEEIANKTWNHVIRNHRTKSPASEVGFTNDIVAIIRDNVLSFPNIGIWANLGYKENIYGSDLDIFVEESPGRYIWWALQAKVLTKGGIYKDLKKKHNNEYQWEKLNKLSMNSGCISRYLFYNGMADYSYSGSDKCNRAFNEKQFGCSLVLTSDVEQIALSATPTFYHFHPSLAQPWRIITCCLFNSKKENATHYSHSQIREAVKYYPESPENIKIMSFIKQETKKLNQFPIDAINEFSKLIDHNPAYRIVIRSTNSL
ncbi:MAG: hypothetical protein PHT69_08565 [Bacteroidales bacterium]|nr:hypothetical protein [Bacteroidales bacterium]